MGKPEQTVGEKEQETLLLRSARSSPMEPEPSVRQGTRVGAVSREF